MLETEKAQMNTPRHFTRHCIAWLALFLAVPALAADKPPACAPVSEAPKSLAAFQLKPGKYQLTLVATGGYHTHAGAAASGVLTLRATSARDVSPKTGKGAAKGERLLDRPLYGTVALDFVAVNAPVSRLSGSADPIYPDVLVEVIDFHGIERQPVVVIGSPGNRRDDVGITDGDGIGLFTRQIGENGFAGTWDSWGIVRGGHGYFCARRIADQ